MMRSFFTHTPPVRSTARRCVLALATTYETARRLRRLSCEKVEVLSQVALPDEEVEALNPARWKSVGRFRIVSVGRLIPSKGFHFGLKVFARVLSEFPDCEYWIVGDGPERDRLGRLANELEVAHAVRFWGSLQRPAVLERLASCDLLLHPSLHESGGYVCVEAMALGKPVVCLELGGPALIVTSKAGCAVPAKDPDSAVEMLSEACLRLVRDPELYRGLSIGARERVLSSFRWEVKRARIGEIYRRVGRREPREPESGVG